MQNPYAKFLTGADLIEQVSSTPAKLEAAVRSHDLDTPLAPGKWSVRQVLAHLTDTEIAFSFRMRQAVAETGHVIQPFDQDKWATSYAQADAETALVLFTVLRKWNVQFLRGLAPETFDKEVTHPERGTMKFRTIVETMAGHDGNHLAQLAG
jgi:hypothetical protein